MNRGSVVGTMCGMACLAVASLSPGASAQAARLMPQEVASWREDIRALASELPRRHKNAFFRASRASFDSAVARLDADVPRFRRDQIIVGMMRIVAMLNDAHTVLPVEIGDRVAFHGFPIRFHQFTDGLFVQAASPEYRSLVGARVVQFGRVSAQAAMDSVAHIVPHENDFWVKERGPALLSVAEVDHALGLSDSAASITLVVERDGKRESVQVNAGAVVNAAGHGPPTTAQNWLDMRDASSGTDPLWLQHPRDVYWMEFLPDSRTVYIGYRAVISMPGAEPNDAFFRRVFAFADSTHAERVVLDVRQNGGGNGDMNRNLVRSIVQHPSLDRPDKLFVIIGRATFSAAAQLVNQLAYLTNATFVGEPTGNAPNQFGDTRPMELPNSKLLVMVSSRWHQSPTARDAQRFVAPKIAAELSSSEYRDRVDPAMRAILGAGTRRPLAALLDEALAAGDSTLALRRFTEYREAAANKYIDVEAEGNAAGYGLLNANRVPRAVAVFELTVRSFPQSANAHDSLGEAYERAGRRDAAIAEYRKAISLDSSAESPRAALRRLGVPPLSS